jgi:HSP20 family molecular chaperone IbpA
MEETAMNYLSLFDPVSPFGTIFRKAASPVRTYEVYHEENGPLVLEVELPGCTPEELKVETEGDVLRIDVAHEDDRRKYEFKKEFSLGETLDPKKIEAELKGGILKIRLPEKKAKKSDVKAITVTT